jgi:DNA-binding MarR family transcriptional regulator
MVEPPSPPDLLELRAASLSQLLAAIDGLVPNAADERHRQAMSVVAEMAIDESVRLIRRAPRAEIVDASSALSRWCSGPAGQAAEAVDPGTHGALAGLMAVLTAAAAPDGKDGDALVLRSWNGNARKVVELVAAAPDSVLARADLRSVLHVSESYLSHLLSDLEAASLVERVLTPGRRGIDVQLGGRGHALVRAQAQAGDGLAGAPVAAAALRGPRRGVERPRAEGLAQRLGERDRRAGRALAA